MSSVWVDASPVRRLGGNLSAGDFGNTLLHEGGDEAGKAQGEHDADAEADPHELGTEQVFDEFHGFDGLS